PDHPRPRARGPRRVAPSIDPGRVPVLPGLGGGPDVLRPRRQGQATLPPRQRRTADAAVPLRAAAADRGAPRPRPPALVVAVLGQRHHEEPPPRRRAALVGAVRRLPRLPRM